MGAREKPASVDLQVIVPYTFRDPKSRLASLLSTEERRDFARIMLEDVLAAIAEVGHPPTVLAPPGLTDISAPIIEDERPLTPAVNAILEPPTAVIMADLPLLTPGTIRDAFDQPGDVVIGPGRGGGTNLLVVRDDAFEVDFHGHSLADHRRIASTAGLTVTEVDSHRVSADVDEPADLVEVLLHGSGTSPEWLREHGFGMTATAGRVSITRESDDA